MKEKRQILLDTALQLFVEQGFHATPTSQIAQKAGVATGTLFHYFKTKEELINSLYLETKERLIQELSAGVEQQSSIKGKLKQLFFNGIHWSLNHPQQQLFYYQFSHSPFISGITKEIGEQRVQFVYEILEEGIASDILKSVPVDLLFEAANGLMNGVILHLMEEPEKRSAANYLEEAFCLFWDAIKG